MEDVTTTEDYKRRWTGPELEDDLPELEMQSVSSEKMLRAHDKDAKAREGIDEPTDKEDSPVLVEDIPDRQPKRHHKDDDELPGQSQRTALRRQGARIFTLMARPIQNTRKKADRALELNGLERNSTRLKDFDRLVLRPILADQLKVPLEVLAKPLGVQMAAVGSRSTVLATTTVDFEYQKRQVKTMPKVIMGLNPTKVGIGSNEPLPIQGEQVARIPSRAAEIVDDKLQTLRDDLKHEALDLCKDVSQTDLPPLQAVNHKIPLIDESKVYPWRPSRCPDTLKPLWRQKKDEYIKSGRWRVATGTNASPLLILKKKPGPNGELRIWTVVDKRAQNSNTRKMASPLPDIESILRNVDAYEQIRVKPEHVSRTIFTTPDGTMESLVLQQGDCNGGATYQALMNHIFAPYIGKFMDVYLDDIVIYSDTVAEHLEHIRIVLDVLRKESLFLSADKMHFFAEKMNLLGHVITNKEIQIDPHKVDSIAAWKTPTSKDLLAGFIGTVGFMAGGCNGIRIPMPVLTPLTRVKVWSWGPTEQRAFDDVKQIVQEHRDVHTRPISDDPNAGPINLMTDALLTSGGRALSQGTDIMTANYIAFWSGKFSAAQQNYPTHERELLAVVETLKRFQHHLIRRRFRLYTDHKALKWFDTQKELSHRQLRWSKFMQKFEYEVHYLPGPKNVVGDALSRMYSDEPAGVVRTPTEMVSVESDSEEEGEHAPLFRAPVSAPVYTGAEVFASLAMVLEPHDEPQGNTDVRGLRRSSRIRNKRQGTNDTQTDEPPTHLENPAEGQDTRTTAEPAQPLKIQLKIPPALRKQSVPKENESAVNQSDSSNTGNTPNTEQQPQGPREIPMEQVSEEDNTNTLIDIVSRVEMNVIELAKGTYTFFSLVLAEPERYGNFAKRDGLIYLREGDEVRLGIPDATTGGRRLREVLISQAHLILAHLGTSKTHAYLRKHVWWPKMRSDVEAFCESCTMCSSSKARTQGPYGLLKSLPVPTRPWQSIGIDFVGPLPTSKTRNG
ncbi:hypothetical protein FRC04_003767 [Tulasnella sp. 424]|nr:hypothetical protein FRC04_003767 [Tulasnella sp. 424]